MDARIRREPEPVEIELVMLDADDPDADGHPDRPPPAGVGTVPSTAVIVHRALERVRNAPDPPLGPDQHQLHPSFDVGVRRVVRLPSAALVALTALLATPPTRAPSSAPAPERCGRAGRRGATWTGRRLGALERLTLGPPIIGDDITRFSGVLRIRRHAPAKRIELVAAPWSGAATELWLHARVRRSRPHLPDRFFDVAHLVMDELTTMLEDRTASCPSHPRRRS